MAFNGRLDSAFLRRGGANLLLCIGIAALLGAMPGGRFGAALVYSLCIGTLCWLAVDGGRFVVARGLARRQPASGALLAGWPGWGWMTLVIVIGVSVAFALGSLVARAIVGEAEPLLAGERWRGGAFVLLLSITATVVATAFFSARGRMAAAQAEAEAARRAAAETRLKLLESQLEPHMLFNTLANLRVLIGTDPPRAQAMLDRLIGFLRATLNASRSGMHPLAAEFERLADYLALMATRMGPRLVARFDLPADLREQPVPPLLLQPLVENAIRHGLEPRVEGGRIEVSARRTGDRLVLAVRDTGIGLSAGSTSGGTNFGLAQVRDRLAALYGERARFTLEPAGGAEGGAVARIELPSP